MSAWDVVLGAGVVALVANAVRSLWLTRRRGGCASCPYAGGCGKARPDGCEVRHG